MSDPAVEAYLRDLTPLGVSTLSVLSGLEAVQRRLHPPVIPELRGRLAPLGEQLDERLAAFRELTPPAPLERFHASFLEAAERARKAVHQFCSDAPQEEAIIRVLGSMRSFGRSLEALYALVGFPPVSQYFLEEPVRDRYREFLGEPAVELPLGLQMSGGEEDPAGRGQFALYVPETYDGTRDLPLVVALHGGSGTGREFVWTWLREARTRHFALIAPTSIGSTWALMGPDVDAGSLAAMVDFAAERYRIDRSKVLLTGLSDGATYSLLAGLAEDAPYSHLAPISGVFHPVNETNGNLGRASGRPVYLVHGALDWMFPVETARNAAEVLEKAGAQLVYRELADLSHTYPREENARILEWFDPALAIA